MFSFIKLSTSKDIVVFSCIFFAIFLAAYISSTSFLYIAAAIAILVAFKSKSPIVSLSPFCLFITWGAEIWNVANPRLYTIVKLGILLIFLVRVYNNFKTKTIIPFGIILFLFILYNAISEMAHVDEPDYLTLVNLGLCYLIIYLCMNHTDREEYSLLSLSLGLGICFSALFSLVSPMIPSLLAVVVSMIQTTNEFDLMDISTGRFAALCYDPNQYGLYVISALASCLLVMQRKKYKNILWHLVVSIALIVFGLMTLSKTVFLLLVVLLFVYIRAVFSDKSEINSRTKSWIFLSMIVIGVLFLYEMADYFTAFVLRFNSATNASELTTNRSDIWSRYINILSDNSNILLFGNSLQGRIPNYSTPHNFILYMLFFFGIFGSVLYLLFISYIIKSSIKNRQIYNRIGFVDKFPILFYFLFSLSTDPFMLYDAKTAILAVCFTALTTSQKEI